MKYKIQRFFRNLALPNLMTYISATMVIIYLGVMFSGFRFSMLLNFNRSEILHGQIWRIITFMGEPVSYSQAFFFAVTVIFYYSIGRDLEEAWGSHNLTLYLLTGWLLTAVGGFITGRTSNMYIYLSMFLAYATLMPNNTFMLFFFLPVKAKWLALIDAVSMIGGLLFSSASGKVAVLASLITYAVFFGKDYLMPLLNRIKNRDFIAEMRRKNIKMK